VLCYHRVSRDGSPGSLSTGRFEAHLRHLAAHYTLGPPSEVVEALAAGRPLPGDFVAVTFDDGYADLLDEALPALARHGTRAGFFVLTAHLPGPGALFLDRIRGTPLEGERRTLASLPSVEREHRIAAASPGVAPRLMDAAGIRRLREAGHEVGSHGRTHGLLTAVPPDEARGEVAESRAELLRHAAVDASLFAYPWGSHGPDTRALVREAGYRAAFTTEGTGIEAKCDPFAIPRIHVPGDASVSRLACEAAGLVGALRRVFR
jgi:peptidoglycan/xylan/chitin deacetylase (PgdA/CDA1 family)